MTILCPCGSQENYDTCCGKFHRGETPATPLQLMRSRYTAYAKGLSSYIMETTHPASPSYQKDRNKWEKEILHFSKYTQFKKLDILDQKEGVVVFHVTLASLQGEDCSFTEESFFQKREGKWLYLRGNIK